MKKVTKFIIIVILTSISLSGLSFVSCKQASPAITTAPATLSITTTSQTSASTTVETTAEASETTTSTASVETTTATSTTTSSTETGTTSAQEQQQIAYTNAKYGFNFSLPISWQGYSVIVTQWEGNPIGSADIVEQGPIISIRNPKWTSENPYQDIPIMVFTSTQWDALLKEEFHIGAAPIGPSELGHNLKYVFALPARYNFSNPAGVEEVEKILEGNPLKAF